MRRHQTFQNTDHFRYFWRRKEIMIDILWRDEFTCQLCGSHRHLQIHHIKPRSRGGDNAQDNLLTLCRECHHAVHHGRIPLAGTSSWRSEALYLDEKIMD